MNNPIKELEEKNIKDILSHVRNLDINDNDYKLFKSLVEKAYESGFESGYNYAVKVIRYMFNINTKSNQFS